MNQHNQSEPSFLRSFPVACWRWTKTFLMLTGALFWMYSPTFIRVTPLNAEVRHADELKGLTVDTFDQSIHSSLRPQVFHRK